jgi:glutaminyl-tRNA synthetase
MPTISGLRRRGYTANSIRKFCDIIGAKRENIDFHFWNFVREDLNNGSKSYGGSRSNKISNYDYPEDKEEWLEAENNQEDKAFRKVPFLENYLLKEDF